MSNILKEFALYVQPLRSPTFSPLPLGIFDIAIIFEVKLARLFIFKIVIIVLIFIYKDYVASLCKYFWISVKTTKPRFNGHNHSVLSTMSPWNFCAASP